MGCLRRGSCPQKLRDARSQLPCASPPGRGTSLPPAGPALSPTQRSAAHSAPGRGPHLPGAAAAGQGRAGGGGARRCPASLPLALPQSRLLENLGSDLVLIRAGERDFYSLDPLLESRRTCLIS